MSDSFEKVLYRTYLVTCRNQFISMKITLTRGTPDYVICTAERASFVILSRNHKATNWHTKNESLCKGMALIIRKSEQKSIVTVSGEKL
jgi:hypothetical protein